MATSTGSGASATHLLEVAPLEVLHHHVGDAVLEGIDVVDLHRVVVLDLRREARLAQEALHDVGARSREGLEVLDGDGLVELHVLRLQDDAEPTLADDTLDQVLAGDDGAGSERGAHAASGRDRVGGRFRFRLDLAMDHANEDGTAGAPREVVGRGNARSEGPTLSGKTTRCLRRRRRS